MSDSTAAPESTSGARLDGKVFVLTGAAGPRRKLREIPFSEAEMRARGDERTMLDSAMNLLGAPWNMARAAVPHMAECGSIINISTIFSRTQYYGRIPYTVPKSGLNALSHGLALELGDERGIRVNTVFAAMDNLQRADPGTTSKEFRGLMIARRQGTDGDLDYRYPTPADVAPTVTWPSTSESASLSGHAIEVTNGMQVQLTRRARAEEPPRSRNSPRRWNAWATRCCSVLYRLRARARVATWRAFSGAMP